ncbi:hypothetical protein J6590_023630 [Homalodisca vitripennis]|nr:hypothetical protein J6590_023630 [Homalodisca vitripennis]
MSIGYSSSKRSSNVPDCFWLCDGISLSHNPSYLATPDKKAQCFKQSISDTFNRTVNCVKAFLKTVKKLEVNPHGHNPPSTTFSRSRTPKDRSSAIFTLDANIFLTILQIIPLEISTSAPQPIMNYYPRKFGIFAKHIAMHNTVLYIKESVKRAADRIRQQQSQGPSRPLNLALDLCPCDNTATAPRCPWLHISSAWRVGGAAFFSFNTS